MGRTHNNKLNMHTNKQTNKTRFSCSSNYPLEVVVLACQLVDWSVGHLETFHGSSNSSANCINMHYNNNNNNYMAIWLSIGSLDF